MMMLPVGTKVHVAPEDLTGDDGFRDIGTVIAVEGDQYVIRCDECDNEAYTVNAEQVSVRR